MVGCPLTACQVNEGNLAESVLFVLDADLQNGMRPRRLIVSVVLGRHSKVASLLNQVKELLSAAY